jgi:hypothetical protein
MNELFKQLEGSILQSLHIQVLFKLFKSLVCMKFVFQICWDQKSFVLLSPTRLFCFVVLSSA